MAFDYDRDDAAHRLIVTYRGDFLVSEAIAILDQIGTDGTWSYSVLYDLRGLTSTPSLDDLRQVVDARTAIQQRVAIPRGPVAALVTDQEKYVRACAYAALGRAVTAVEVFRSRDESDSWLAEQAARFGHEPNL